MKFSKYLKTVEIIFFLFVTLLFITKLDHYYFFTDELLYAYSGTAHFQGDYSSALQVSPLPKYIAGLMFTISNGNLAIMRLPYALMGIATCYLVYLVLKKEFGSVFGFIGAAFFATSRIIFDASRMVMLEPLLHLFWMLFLYFYYDSFFKSTKKLYLLSGLFLGLSLSIKLSSLVLFPFIALGFLYKVKFSREEKPLLFKNYFSMLAIGGVTVFIGYLHFIFKAGIVTAALETLRAIKSTYITKSAEGKVHVINQLVYEKSPWWTYGSYFLTYNSFFRAVIAIFLGTLALFKKNFFVLYWGTFFVLVLGFYQLSGVKNVRYVSSVELPLIFLMTAGLHFLFQKYKKSTIFLFVTLFTVFFLFLTQIGYLSALKYTEYEGLFRYFKAETSNFTEYKRLYAFGSVRSLKYYREQVPDVGMLLWRKDYEVMCPEFDTFDYFAFDKEEILKNPDNYMYRYIQANDENFERVPQVMDMYVFKKIAPFESKLSCPE